MEILSWLPKFIAELGYKLFDKERSTDLAKKERFADLVDQIADCTQIIGNAVNNGEHPTSQCAELSIYLQEVGALTREITDAETAEKLMFWLYHAEAVPGYSKIDIEQELLTSTRPKRKKTSRLEQSNKVLEISGMLKAVANLLRV